MTVRSRVQTINTNFGKLKPELHKKWMARFHELAGPGMLDREEAASYVAQVAWEMYEDKLLTVGDLCFVIGNYVVIATDTRSMLEMLTGAVETYGLATETDA